MAKEKKQSTPFSARMDTAIYNRLEKFCKESGQSKTVAIERALMMYIDDYEIKMQELNKKNKEK